MGHENFDNYEGRTIYDIEGAKLGTIKDVYLEGENDQPVWATVTSGLFGTKQYFIPLQGLKTHEDGLMTPFTKDAVKDAPSIEAGSQLTEHEEQQLYRHYGMRTAGGGNSADGGEEEAGTTTNGRVRLRKYIITEVIESEAPLEGDEFTEEEMAMPGNVSQRQQPVFGETRTSGVEDRDHDKHQRRDDRSEGDRLVM